jgi:hypothetical protein
MAADFAVVVDKCTLGVLKLLVDGVSRKCALVVWAVFAVFVGSEPWLPSMYRAASQK